LEGILGTAYDTTTINEAGALLAYLGNDDFLYWLNFFNEIMPHVDVLDSQLRKCDAVAIDKHITYFNAVIQKIFDRILTTTDNLKKSISLDICDLIASEIGSRFKFTDQLNVSCLFQKNYFASYNSENSGSLLNSLLLKFTVINVIKLRSELGVLHSREEFRKCAGAVAILQLFLDMKLIDTFSESVRLLEVICTIPMTTREDQRCFSTSKRIKSFLRSTAGESGLSALAMLNVEKSWIRSIPDFNDLVVEHFAKQKGRGMDLLYRR